MHSSSEISFNFPRTLSVSQVSWRAYQAWKKFSSIAYNVRKRSVNHGDTVVRVPANGRIQSLKINTLLNNMPDNIIRTVKTFTNKFNTMTSQLNFQLWQSSQGCYECGVYSGRTE